MDSIIGRVVATILTLILIGGVGAMAYNGFQHNRESTLSVGVSSMVQSIQGAYGNYPTFTGLENMPVTALGSVKNFWGNSSTTVGTAGGLIDPWGNNITVASGANPPSGSVNVTASNFVITDAGTSFDQSTCASVALAVGASALETLIGGQMVNAAEGRPVDPAQAAAACNGGGKPISWVFGH
ncbi:MAG: type 4 pilus major pilin [Acidithiobacillus sp.]